MSYDDVLVSRQVVEAAVALAKRQDAERGAWPSSREGATQPNPLFPSADNPILAYLLAAANGAVDAGEDVAVTTLHLAVHAWFEGHIEGYDRGQQDARRLKAV